MSTCCPAKIFNIIPLGDVIDHKELLPHTLCPLHPSQQVSLRH